MILGLDAPVGAPLRAVGAVVAAQNFFLGVHSVFHERAAGAVNQKVILGRVGDDAGMQGRAQARILHVDVESVVDLGSFSRWQNAEAQIDGAHRIERAPIDEVRAKVPEDAGGRMIGLFAPVRGGLASRRKRSKRASYSTTVPSAPELTSFFTV